MVVSVKLRALSASGVFQDRTSGALYVNFAEFVVAVDSGMLQIEVSDDSGERAQWLSPNEDKLKKEFAFLDLDGNGTVGAH